MPQPGYQDWGRYPIPSADTVFTANVPVMPNYIGPETDCSSWSSVIVTYENPDPFAYLDVLIGWAGYASALFYLTGDSFFIGPQQVASYAIPVKGRTIALDANVVSGAQTEGGSYSIVGLSHRVSKYEAIARSDFLIGDSRAYGANTNVVITPRFWYEGNVQVSLASSAGANAVASFQCFDISVGGFKEFASVAIQTQSSAMPLRLMFPAAPVQVQVFNFGAAQTINVEIRPSLAG